MLSYFGTLPRSLSMYRDEQLEMRSSLRSHVSLGVGRKIELQQRSLDFVFVFEPRRYLMLVVLAILAPASFHINIL